MDKIISCPADFSKIPELPIGRILFDKINSFDKNRSAMIDTKSGHVYTYGDLVNNSLKLAANLRQLFKITKNDNIAIISENKFEFFVGFLAGLYLGSPVHLINPGYTIYELEKTLKMSQPKLVFCSQQSVNKIKSLQLSFVKFLVLFDGVNDSAIAYSDLIRITSNFEFEQIDLDHVAYIVNSSGTSGSPKAVMITHECARLALSHLEVEKLFNFDENTIVSSVIPFYHLHGCNLCYSCFYAGVKIVMMDKFIPSVYLKSIENYKINTIFIVPTLGDFLANSPQVDSYNLSSITEIYSAAGLLKPETEAKLINKFNLNILRQIYGLSEGVCTIFVTPVDKTKQNTVGKVTPGHSVKIVDPTTDEILGVNQSGEICIKGYLMKGYINNPESTRAAFDSDGFLRTGDVGYYDSEFFFYIVDRLKDLIKYKSLQVAPTEIEEVLIQHPAVKDVAVVGKPDDRYGELPVAFVVKNESVDVGEEELMKFVAGFLCEEKRLHGGVRFVGEIPKTPLGKILRKDLRNLL